MLFSLQLCVHGVLALCLYMCVRKEKVQGKFMLSWGFRIHCGSICQEQRIHQFSLPIHRKQKKRNRQTKLQISNATQDHNNNSRLTTPWIRPHEWACDHCSFPQTSQSKSVMLLEHKHQRPKPPLWLTKSDTPEFQAHKQKAFKTNSSPMVGKRDCLLQVEIFWHSPAPRQGQREKSLRWWCSSNQNWVVSTTTTQPNPQKQTTLKIQKQGTNGKQFIHKKIIIPTPQQNQQCKQIQCKNTQDLILILKLFFLFLLSKKFACFFFLEIY